jgi:hypothetical protein
MSSLALTTKTVKDSNAKGLKPPGEEEEESRGNKDEEGV